MVGRYAGAPLCHRGLWLVWLVRLKLPLLRIEKPFPARASAVPSCLSPLQLARALCRTAAARRLRGGSLFRHVCAAAAAANILLLMAGNLVGFVVGVDGIVPLAQQVGGQGSNWE